MEEAAKPGNKTEAEVCKAPTHRGVQWGLSFSGLRGLMSEKREGGERPSPPHTH